MKKTITLLLVLTALTFGKSAGETSRYIYITQPDGTTLTCWVWPNGDMDCESY